MRTCPDEHPSIWTTRAACVAQPQLPFVTHVQPQNRSVIWILREATSQDTFMSTSVLQKLGSWVLGKTLCVSHSAHQHAAKFTAHWLMCEHAHEGRCHFQGLSFGMVLHSCCCAPRNMLAFMHEASGDYTSYKDMLYRSCVSKTTVSNLSRSVDDKTRILIMI